MARSQVENQFDAKNGGFSAAPKFPPPAIIDFSIRHWLQTRKNQQPDSRILHTALFTLEKMAEGGIFDHLGGGFCRYSTDDRWMIPHFEKMLYDNGPLLSLYSKAWQLTSNPIFHDTVNETARWVLTEMQSPEGAYFSSQDADSEGSEGKYYVWSKRDIDSELDRIAQTENIDQGAVALFRQRFGLDREANFDGRWHLHGDRKTSELASENHLESQGVNDSFRRIRELLLNSRSQRVTPDTDKKILCAWNGLMIHGMSQAGRLLDKPEYIESAFDAASDLKNRGWNNGHLSASIKHTDDQLSAYIDDYAFLIYGLLDLLQSRWDNTLYEWTIELADTLLECLSLIHISEPTRH